MTQLRGLAPVPWDSVFSRFLLEKKYDKGQRKSPWFWLSRLLLYSFVDDFQFDLNRKEGSNILFFTSFVERKSIVDNFKKVRELVKSDLMIKEPTKSSISLIKGFHLLTLLPSWNKSLKCYNLIFSDRLCLLIEIIRIKRLHQVLTQLPPSYHLIVTFYDSLLPESYAIEYFRLLSIKSAVLQHGQFTSWRADNFFDCGIEFKTFKSDYFLAWNKLKKNYTLLGYGVI